MTNRKNEQVDEVPEPETSAAGPHSDIPDTEWVKTADLHAGDEPGQPEATEAKMEATQEAQPEYGIGPDQIAGMEEVLELKREVSEEASSALRSNDYEVGGKEQNYLQGGVTAEHAYAEQQKDLARMRRQANAYPNEKAREEDDRLLA